MWQRIKQWIALGYLVLFSGLGVAWAEEGVAPQQNPNPGVIQETISIADAQNIAQNGQPLTQGQLVAVAVEEQANVHVPPGGNPPPVPIPIFPPVPPVPATEQADAVAAPASSAGGGSVAGGDQSRPPPPTKPLPPEPEDPPGPPPPAPKPMDKPPIQIPISLPTGIPGVTITVIVVVYPDGSVEILPYIYCPPVPIEGEVGVDIF